LDEEKLIIKLVSMCKGQYSGTQLRVRGGSLALFLSVFNRY
jgi:hypothetical protein